MTYTAVYTHRGPTNVKKGTGAARPPREIIVLDAADHDDARRRLMVEVGQRRLADYRIQPSRGTQPAPARPPEPPPTATPVLDLLRRRMAREARRS